MPTADFDTSKPHWRESEDECIFVVGGEVVARITRWPKTGHWWVDNREFVNLAVAKSYAKTRWVDSQHP